MERKAGKGGEEVERGVKGGEGGKLREERGNRRERGKKIEGGRKEGGK